MLLLTSRLRGSYILEKKLNITGLWEAKWWPMTNFCRQSFPNEARVALRELGFHESHSGSWTLCLYTLYTAYVYYIHCLRTLLPLHPGTRASNNDFRRILLRPKLLQHYFICPFQNIFNNLQPKNEPFLILNFIKWSDQEVSFKLRSKNMTNKNIVCSIIIIF